MLPMKFIQKHLYANFTLSHSGNQSSCFGFVYFSSLPDEVAESSLAPLKIRNSCNIRAACQPFKWIDIARTKIAQSPNENRKGYLEEISLKENQKLISDIFILYGTPPISWKGVKIHCPLTKRYDEVKVKLFIKVKLGDEWIAQEAKYDVSSFICI